MFSHDFLSSHTLFLSFCGTFKVHIQIPLSSTYYLYVLYKVYTKALFFVHPQTLVHTLNLLVLLLMSKSLFIRARFLFLLVSGILHDNVYRPVMVSNILIKFV